MESDARRQRDMCFSQHFIVLIHVRPVIASARLLRSAEALIVAKLPCQIAKGQARIWFELQLNTKLDNQGIPLILIPAIQINSTMGVSLFVNTWQCPKVSSVFQSHQKLRTAAEPPRLISIWRKTTGINDNGTIQVCSH
jgi:hypothetical protein